MGRTKAEVRQKLKDLRADLDIGVQSPASYTVRAAVDDWLAEGLSGRSQRTLTLYRDGVRPLTDKIGHKQLRKLTAADVRSALAGLSGQMSTRSLQIAHNCLVGAIRHAEAGDIVGRNVAALIRVQRTRPNRQPPSLTAPLSHAPNDRPATPSSPRPARTSTPNVAGSCANNVAANTRPAG